MADVQDRRDVRRRHDDRVRLARSADSGRVFGVRVEAAGVDPGAVDLGLGRGEVVTIGQICHSPEKIVEEEQTGRDVRGPWSSAEQSVDQIRSVGSVRLAAPVRGGLNACCAAVRVQRVSDMVRLWDASRRDGRAAGRDHRAIARLRAARRSAGSVRVLRGVAQRVVGALPPAPRARPSGSAWRSGSADVPWRRRPVPTAPPSQRASVSDGSPSRTRRAVSSKRRSSSPIAMRLTTVSTPGTPRAIVTA